MQLNDSNDMFQISGRALTSIPFSVDEKIYTFHCLGSAFNLPVGAILVDFVEMDLDAFLRSAQMIYASSPALPGLSDANIEAELFFDGLAGRLSVSGYEESLKYRKSKYQYEKWIRFNPVLTELLVNVFRRYWRSDSNMSLSAVSLAATERWLTKLQDWQSALREVSQRHSTIPQCIASDLLTKNSPPFDEELDISSFRYVDNDRCIILQSVQDIFSAVIYDALEVAEKGIAINTCLNCGKLFIPAKRKDEKYCRRLFDGDRTCKDVGTALHTDPFQAAYRKWYQATADSSQARKYKRLFPKEFEEKIRPLIEAAKAAREEYQERNDLAGFVQWLQDCQL